MKAAFLDKPGHLYVEEVARPDCPEDRVLINVKEIGVCGSDLHYFNEGRIGDHVVTVPHILGHEASGLVVEVGRKVEGFSVGDRVSIEPGVPCMGCEHCREGRYNLCVDVQFTGAPPYQGLFCEMHAHDPRFVYRVPGRVSFAEAALAEPLAVAHNAIRRAALVPGETALVIGAGPIGFSCIEMARLAGAATVIVAEPIAPRRGVALKIGADWALDPASGPLSELVRERTGGRMCDCVFEASGSEAGIADALRCVRRGGRVVYIGMGKAMVSIPHAEILKKEATISGIYRYVNDFRPVIALLSAGKLDVEAWVSHRFPLERIGEAFAAANDPDSGSLKVLVTT
jgi:L-iditol 2-dehydrogenase